MEQNNDCCKCADEIKKLQDIILCLEAKIEKLENYDVMEYCSVDFRKVKTIEYLKKCRFNGETCAKIFRDIHVLNDECQKYVFDKCIEKGFISSLEDNSYFDMTPIQLICHYSKTPEIVKYVLDTCLKKGLNLQRRHHGQAVIHCICDRLSPMPSMIKYILDIYVRKGWDLKCANLHGWSPIDLILVYAKSDPYICDYAIKIYMQKYGVSILFSLLICCSITPSKYFEMRRFYKNHLKNQIVTEKTINNPTSGDESNHGYEHDPLMAVVEAEVNKKNL